MVGPTNLDTVKPSSSEEEERSKSKAWGILLFALIGATATTAAVAHLRKSFDWFFTEINRAAPNSSWKNVNNKNANSGSYYGNFREEAWKRYNEEVWKRYSRTMREEYEKEMERVERLRRMRDAFNKEKNQYKWSYDGWREYGPGAHQHYQHKQQDDWYWNADTSYWERRANSRTTSRDVGSYSMSHHYSVLGLDRSRTEPYSDAEIKTAFRAKALECHPDQNQSNKEVAEAKFKEVMTSYEAIKDRTKESGA